MIPMAAALKIDCLGAAGQGRGGGKEQGLSSNLHAAGPCRCNSGLSRGDSHGNGEKWSAFGGRLKIEPPGPADGVRWRKETEGQE